MDLSGVWEFRLDAAKEGIERKYYGQVLEDAITLPATTAEAHKGIYGEAKETGCLTEPYHFEGYAWYARTLEIPKEHIGDLAQLVIERTRVSYVWVDEQFVGTQDSFAAVHRYDLTKYMTDMSHRLTIMVSNTDYKTGGGHMTSPDTQTNWNGMLGEIALILEPAVRVDNLRVDAEAAGRSVEVHFTAVCRDYGAGRADRTDRESRICIGNGECAADRTVTVCCTVRRRISSREAGNAGRGNVGAAESAQKQRGSAHMEQNGAAGPAEDTDELLLRAYKEILLQSEMTEYVWRMEIPEERKIALWNEYTPNLYQVTVQIMDMQDKRAGKGGTAQKVLGYAEAVAGFRDLRTGRLCEGDSGVQSREAQIFYLNDLPVMLRGKHDGMIFPMTGYAPMDQEAWEKVFRTARAYGINHYRFHTCCPPEAAFAAADELGIYLAPELPFWGTVAGEEETERDREGRMWLLEEGFRILREFGNHPSFVILSLGNELWGDRQVLDDILGRYKAADGRHLYVQGSNNFQFCPVILENDDFFSGVRFARERLFRGSYAMCDAPQGHIQTRMPDNCHSYDEAIRPWRAVEATTSGVGQSADSSAKKMTGERVTKNPEDEEREAAQTAAVTGEVEIQFGTGTKKVKAADGGELIPQLPVVSHEIGQYEFYPDYDEIGKYTGVLQPENLRIFREQLANKGMLHMAKRFFRAAGQLAVDCYKRELETAFRSRELAGFQLLDLQDFTGQGTALVGILNAFMENKGLISAEEWREFCNDRVVMLSFPTYVYETGGTFDYEVLLCNMRPDREAGRKGKTEEVCGRTVIEAPGEGSGRVTDADSEEADVAGNGSKCTDVRITVELADRRDGQLFARMLHEGTWELTRLKSFGSGSLPIPSGDAPMMLRATVTVSACEADQILVRNHYDLYAYPAIGKRQPDGRTSVTVTRDKAQMLACLRAGERVLFFGSGMGEAYSVEGTYCTDFWCYPMFASISESMGKPLPIGTMGLYMDREHPMFAQFPTEGCTTPQWWRIVTGARVAVLDDQPVEPLIWMIDHFSRNHKLGLVYEAKVGAGSLLVCQADLLSQNSPEINWFYDSLLDYVSSEKFCPQEQIEEDWLDAVY